MKKCYICRKELKECHAYYVKLCPVCGEENYRRRMEYSDLEGYVAIVTGARIKIGYHTALRLLRCGATVLATTRFPMDALKTYSAEPDYENWKDRLYVCQMDLKCLQEVEAFVQYVKQKFGTLDILINNAAQTIRKSSEYYERLNLQETKYLAGGDFSLPAANLYLKRNLPAVSEHDSVIQYGEDDEYNSWVARPADITLTEFLEVQVVNVTAPFLLCSRLTDCMKKSSHRNRFIINVTSVEGSFAEKKKSSKHIHTNMAKASLNMLTKSLGKDMAKENIFVYSVDPGWVSNQFPAKWNGVCDESFEAPLTYEDAAARICAPVQEHKDEDYVREFGILYKDYGKWQW